ncbi:DUF1217 domain-containing protein [Defluviimonas salinarum]|uniref:DUF1217 domain-containing protein n=1 Tax=Defluviimonas salinarum TaxID=2992147 RepID=A0ABT3J681_9RHOB|nr:DUF1217 domain-containing protein [Defluviimonas salinarum]MCW3783196.1 DUF1217 domain-containing protein [Defluviimonas salinarum]
MSFTPVIPFGGYTGWKFLAKTRAAQQEAFFTSAPQQREEAYFRERIGSIGSAEALVADRRLLSVALGAFGLGDDINNRYFVRKVLEDGTLDPDALANKLADKRYLELSKAFGFGDYAVPRTRLSDFADRILEGYRMRRFEAVIGEQNPQMRFALNAERELGAIATRSISDDAKWFNVLGSPPLREVFQVAFGLPSAFVSIDLDRQVSVLKDRARRFLGSSGVVQFADPAKVENLVRLYLLRSETRGFGAGYSASTAALTLLQNGDASGGLLSRRI